LNKVADKIVPKEIAPILPIAAMMIPGLQGMSPLLRYGLPQLATALSSAKTTGKINPMAQVLTGLTSYAAGPGGQTASGKQQAFFDANTQPTYASAGGGAPVPGLQTGTELSTAGTGLTAASDPISFARANPDAFKAFSYEPSSILEQTGNLLQTWCTKSKHLFKRSFWFFW
jgi:hypothetical protein